MTCMTKQELSQYRAIKREISYLEAQIKALSKNPPLAVDMVKGSDDEWPYCERSFTITGVDKDKMDELLSLYEVRLTKLTETRIQIEHWIADIDDSVVRQIVQLRYVDGRSWSKTAVRLYGSPCVDAPRKALDRYLDKFS